MRITFNARLRAFLQKHGPATIDQIVAALGRHVTAVQALRAWDRSRNSVMSRMKKSWSPSKKSQSDKVRVGTRRIVVAAITALRQRKEIVCTGHSYNIAS